MIAPTASAGRTAPRAAASTRPRVALVAPSLAILGGQSVQARLLLEHLRADGWPVELVPIDARHPRALGAVRRVRYARTLANEALYAASLRRLARADVVHVMTASYWSFLLVAAPAIAAARALGRPVVLNYHSGEAADHLARWGPLVHPWLRAADALVVPSEYLRAVFARHGYRARVIPNVIDAARLPFRERDPLRPRLLSNRNLEALYRVDVTIAAFARLRRRRPDATLAVAGYGGEERRLRALAAPIGGVTFLGRVEPPAMPRVYEDADLYANASVVDNQPLSILEAFASGLPVVTTTTGGIAAMVREGETGFAVPPDDPAAMAEALEEALARPERARAMARCARALAEAHAWPAVRERWAAVYRRPR